MTSENIFAPNYQDIPYWWEAAPRQQLNSPDLVRSVDVAVIGSGYTGLHAALQTARAGRSTLVLEKDLTGYGCSSRNGGQIGTSFKPRLKDLEKKFGQATAFNMIQEGQRALDYLKTFISEEKLDCDLQLNGRFVGAHSKKAFEREVSHRQNSPKAIAEEFHVVPKAEVHQEIGSNRFHAGVVLPSHGSLHPGKYHLELLDCVLHSGAMVIDQCPVLSIERKSNGFRLNTKLGPVDAADVVLATNGYTSDQFDWHRVRVMPIGSFQIATEQLPQDLIYELIPNARVITDTQLIGNYFRLSPDHTRVLFGGRVTFSETNATKGSKLLHRQLCEIFPQISDVKTAYSWVGFIAYTTDSTPHIGVHDGLYYSMGYCGSGITLASYFGMRVGQKVLGSKEGDTALDHLKFKPWPSITRSSMVLASATRCLRFVEKYL